jgi:putative Mn2+ efflux pump MntP
VVGKLIALVLPLGLDTFAVAAAVGMLGTTPATRLRISILFPAFEAAMPLIGLALGAPLGRAIGDSADYVAIGVLLAFGLYTLLGSEAREERSIARLAETRGIGALLLLGLSISLDELAIGFTLGLLRLPAGLVIALIAIQAVILTQLGLRLGNRLSERTRESAERIAGLALTGLAIVLLVEKLVA